MGRFHRIWSAMTATAMVALAVGTAAPAGASNGPPQATISRGDATVPAPNGYFDVLVSLANFDGPSQPISGTWTFSYEFDAGAPAAPTPVLGADGTSCLASGTRYDCTFSGTIPYNGYTADVRLPFYVQNDLVAPSLDCFNRVGSAYCGTIRRFVDGVEQASHGLFSVVIDSEPVAFDDVAAMDPATQTQITIPVLANDRDAEGDPLTIGSILIAPRGDAQISGDTIVYTPGDDLTTPDELVYEACDQFSQCSMGALVTVSLGPVGPANDDFVNAEPITGFGTWSGELAGATVEPGEPVHNGGNAPNLTSIWYAWTPSVSGYQLVTAYPTGGPLWSMYPPIYRVDPGSGGFHDLVSNAGLFFAGVTYYIAIEPGMVPPSFLPAWSEGHVTLDIAPFPTPHDNFAAAYDFDFSLPPDGGSAGYFSPYNHSATAETGEPAHGGSPAAQSIWFAVSSRSRPGSFQFDYEAFDDTQRLDNSGMRVAVYEQTGSGFAGLVPVTPTSTAPLEWVTQPGARYYVAFDSGPPQSWYFDLMVTFIPSTTTLPKIVPSLATTTEGNAGSVTIDVPVTLSAPSAQTVTADWTTFPYAASGVASTPDDYQPASGVVTFAPGETAKTVSVVVNADMIDEPDEYILVPFRNPTNARLGGLWGLGFGLIQDDDPPPVVLPGLASAAEGDVIDVPVSLSAASGRAVTVEWTTLPIAGPESASPPADYQAASGVVTFAPGETAKTVPIVVNDDALDEPDEYIVVSFRNPTNAKMGGFWGLGFGVIEDDD